MHNVNNNVDKLTKCQLICTSARVAIVKTSKTHDTLTDISGSITKSLSKKGCKLAKTNDEANENKQDGNN